MNDDILFFAFRYVLGRMSYSVKIVTDEILHSAEHIRPKLRKVMMKEIDEAYRENRLGMDMDAERWHRVRKKLAEL